MLVENCLIFEGYPGRRDDSALIARYPTLPDAAEKRGHVVLAQSPPPPFISQIVNEFVRHRSNGTARERHSTDTLSTQVSLFFLTLGQIIQNR